MSGPRQEDMLVTLPMKLNKGQRVDNIQPSDCCPSSGHSKGKVSNRLHVPSILQRVIPKRFHRKHKSRLELDEGESCGHGMSSPTDTQEEKRQEKDADRLMMECQQSENDQQALQHSSSVALPGTSSLQQQPLLQRISQIESVTVAGSQNPCFFGPVSGTFNVTVTAQGDARAPYHVDAIMDNLHTSIQDSTQQGATIQTSGRPDVDGSTTDRFVANTNQNSRKSQDARLAQIAADRCEKALRAWYTTTGSYVQMIPWVDDDTKHIMDIYTSLQMINDVKGGKLESYESIFLVQTREGILIKRIILNGLAGVGKSTLIDRMSYDWAINCGGVLQQYKLVFALKMHSLEQNSELIESVFDQLLDQDISINRHALKVFIATNPEKVLILLDGFDEFMTTNLCESSFGSVLKILNRKEGRDCCVVVTTRSSHVSRLMSKSLVQKPFTHVKVLGFSAEDIEQYIIKFYAEEPRKAHNLFDRIKSSDVLLDLAKSPMLLLLICVLWREDSSLPDTMFRLYSEALSYIFNRKSHTTPEELAKVVIEIGKIAFNGLISPVQLASFEDKEFEKSALDMALRVGLLTSQRIMKGLHTQNSIQFMHMTFQEFCAAKYFQNLLETDVRKFQEILEQMKAAILLHPAGFAYLLRFCCGDNELCAERVLETLQQNPFSDAVLKVALVCFFETQSNNCPSVNFVTSVLTDRISIEEYNSDCLNSFLWFLKQVIDLRGSTDNAGLANVQEMLIRRCNLQRFDSGLAYCMSRMTTLSVMILNDCSLTASNMEHIASVLGHVVNLRELDLSGNENLGGSVPLWACHMLTLKRLQILRLDNCHLNRNDVRCLATSVGYMKQLEDCSVQTDVHHQTYKDDLIWPTNPLVSQTDKETCIGHGIKLNMTETSLTGTEMADLLEAMSQRDDLVKLILSQNRELSGSAALWFCSLKLLKQLEHLVLSGCLLQCADIEYIAVSLGDMPNMMKLDLSNNNLGGLAMSWAPHLQGMSHLQRLSLRSCSLTGEDAKLMFISLSSITSLVKLDLSFNEALGGFAVMWAPYLQRLKYLQKLYLRQCAFVSEDVRHIAVTLSNMKACIDLNLSSNEQLGGSAENWSHQLMSMQYLRNVDLLGCNLNKQDLKNLASSFGRMPNLISCSIKSPYLSGRFVIQQTKSGIRLDLSQRSLAGKDLAYILEAMSRRNDLADFFLSGSDAIGGSAVLWSEHLKQLKHIEQLELHHCSLQGTDIKHISATLRDMASLTKLDLSLNDSLGGSGKVWSQYLKQMKHLGVLDLSSCALTGIDMKHIAESLGDMPSLKELKLSHNETLAGSASLWYSYLQSLHKLQTLELDDCNFKRQEFKYIAASVGHMVNLVNCSVKNNYMGGRFQCLIKPVSTGIHVSLSERTLSGTVLVDIVQALSARADLTELSLIGNDTLGGTASLWSPSLKYLKHLQLLVLKRCSLQVIDIDPIAKSLSVVPSLVGLELSDNITLGGQGQTWAPHLQHLKHLQKLQLSCCGLTCNDVKHIALACSLTPTITELNFSYNETLSQTGASWVPYLQQIPNLQKLMLVECLLTDEDREIITVTLSETTLCYDETSPIK